MLLRNINDPNHIVEYDPLSKLGFVQIDNSKTGSFSFLPEATLYFNDKKIIADTFSGTISCPNSSPKLTAPNYYDASLVPGSSGELKLE